MTRVRTRYWGANMQNMLRQSSTVALLGTAMHEALAEFHVMHDEYEVPSFQTATARIQAALGADPRNRTGHKL